MKARDRVQSDVRKGILPRIGTQKCKNCGGKAGVYHHHKGYFEEGYDVIPLCHSCLHSKRFPKQRGKYKECSICGRTLHLSSFYRHRKGYRAGCKECISKRKRGTQNRSKKWHEKDKLSGRKAIKDKASARVRYAVKSGKLEPVETKKCVYCFSQAEVYHHWKGYLEEGFDVILICRRCLGFIVAERKVTKWT